MAMLAEKRQRTKWCLNPMGNDWAKDENKFGQRMLEKMGWEPGTGLGSRGQGRTEIIKLNVKCDTRGFGCQVKNNSDNWKENLESFDNLLAQLNSYSKSSEDENETFQLKSLEEKSKASRTRVHYHKFTRGKDVSKYSANDLKCILPLSKNINERESNQSQNNMYEYFKNKKKDEEKKTNNFDTKQDIQFHHEDNHLESNPLEEKNKKKKKKRKTLEDEDGHNYFTKQKAKESTFSKGIVPEEDEEFIKNEHSHEIETTNFDDDSEIMAKKSKKKKKKKKGIENLINFEDSELL